jgi:hypothetical protein
VYDWGVDVDGFDGVLLACVEASLVRGFLIFFRVEFQSKFFKGDGYRFEPFSFDQYVEENKDKVITED